MKNLSFCCFVLLFISCRSHKYDHPVKFIYNTKYEYQSLVAFDFLDDEAKAIKLGIELLSIYYTDENIDFHLIDSFRASSVNSNTIWKVKVTRKELINNSEELVQYFVYIRRSDGALLYARRESGEWIGSTDLEEGLLKNK